VWRTVAVVGAAVVAAGIGAAVAIAANAAPVLVVVVSTGVLAIVLALGERLSAARGLAESERVAAQEAMLREIFISQNKQLYLSVGNIKDSEVLVGDLEKVLSGEAYSEIARELAAPRPVARYVVVAGPERVTAGSTFEITIELLRDPPTDIPGAVSVDVTPSVDAEGRRTGDPVTITVYPSSAFEVVGQPKAELDVIRDADPEPAVFQIHSLPAARGPQELLLVLYQGTWILGEVRLIIKVRAPAPAWPGAPARLTNPPEGRIRRSLVVPPLPRDDVPDPDVVIWVSRVTSEGRDTLHYSYAWPARGWPSVGAGKTEFLGTVNEWLRPKLEELSEAAQRPVPGDRTAPAGGARENEQARRYEVIGKNLYSELFPPDLRDFYNQFAPIARTLLIFSDEPWIPWELLRPWGDGVVDGDFLCAKFDMSRWYYSDQLQVPNGQLAVREVAPVLPRSNLAAVQYEAEYFEQLPERWPHVVNYTPLPVRRRNDVTALLTSGRAQVLHFASHGVLRNDDGGIASIVLEDGVLTAEEIVGDEIAIGLRTATPLVFMNACHSGRQMIGLTRPDGWVERCLDLGCRGFLGANWEVNDELAARFAIDVYGGLVAGWTIAHAVREARRQLRAIDESNPTWLAYTLYAHPNMTLRPAR
jgi:hypothetical protein